MHKIMVCGDPDVVEVVIVVVVVVIVVVVVVASVPWKMRKWEWVYEQEMSCETVTVSVTMAIWVCHKHTHKHTQYGFSNVNCNWVLCKLKREREGGRLGRSGSWSTRGSGRGSQTTFNNSTFNISMYAPQRAASYKLRLGTESFGNEFIIVGILGSVPTPAAGKD